MKIYLDKGHKIEIILCSSKVMDILASKELKKWLVLVCPSVATYL